MLDACKYAAIALLAIALACMSGLYLNKRDELAAYQGKVEATAKAAEEANAKAAATAKKNLQQVKEDYETNVQKIRAGANANYAAMADRLRSERLRVERLRNQHSGSGSVPADAARVEVDDGAAAQRVSASTCTADPEFVADAAEDAAKVEAWREWCKLNHCEVEE